MDKVYEELDETKAENEKLKADYRSKTQLLENLKRAQNEQLIKNQEANSAIEKQVQELSERTAEISVLRQTNEDLKRYLNEKESIIKHVAAANDKLRADGEDKYRKFEEENQKLLFALEESNEKNVDLEQKINVHRAEIEGLRELLSTTQKKCKEAGEIANGRKELREIDDMLITLEDEKSKIEERLKWKKEQFKHLEEAHKKLRNQCEASKKEWEQERSTMFGDISSLQTKLDSQTRILEDVQKKLQMCNFALTQEETRRKKLEVQVSEFKARYEDVFAECRDTKSQLDCLTAKRDKEVAALRHSLSTKEAYFKEMEYQKGKLEQENLELLASIKELQEAGIQGSGNSSLAKLKSKLKSVEQLHKKCSVNFRAKEAEWNSQLEKITADINKYMLQLESKEAEYKKLEMELEYCLSSAIEMKLQYEEISVMSLVLKSKLSEAQLKLADIEDEMIIQEKERETKFSLLTKQLEQRNLALAKALRDIKEERENSACLLQRIESLDLIDDHRLQMQKVTERYKEMLEESSGCQIRLKEQIKQMENEHEEKLRQVCDALDMANSELTEEHEKVELLTRRVESFGVVEEKQLMMQNEIGRYKEMLDESAKCQRHLEEQVSQMESDSKERIGKLCGSLKSANSKLAAESEKTAMLIKKIESFDQIEENRQKELKRYKEMLEESFDCQHHLNLKIVQVETNSQRKYAEVSEALQIANSELIEKTCEANRLEFESWVWKSIAERFKTDLEEIQNLRKRLEASLLTQVEVGENIKREKDDLVRKIEAVNSARRETATCVQSEKEALLQMMSEKDQILEGLQKEVEWLEQESFRRELEGAAFANITAERTFENVKEIARLVDQKDKKLDELEQNLKSSFKSFTSQLAKKQAEADMVYQAWEKIAAAEIMAELEIEEKKLMIIELERYICNIQQKLETQEKSLSHYRQQASEIEAELEIRRSELREVTSQMQEKSRTSDALVDKLSGENRRLLEEATRLLSERENLLGFISELDDGMSKLSNEDMSLMGDWGKMMQSFDEPGHFNRNLSIHQQKLETQEKSLFCLRQQALEIESELEKKQNELRELTDQMQEKERTSDALINELSDEKKTLLEEVTRLSSERENLFCVISEIEDGMSKLSNEDMKLMGDLGKMMKSLDKGGFGEALRADDKFSRPAKENFSILVSPQPLKKQELDSEERSPFRPLN